MFCVSAPYTDLLLFEWTVIVRDFSYRAGEQQICSPVRFSRVSVPVDVAPVEKTGGRKKSLQVFERAADREDRQWSSLVLT